MQTIQFLLAVGIGGVIGVSGLGLVAVVSWIVAVAFGLSLITSIVTGFGLLRTMKSPYGITIPSGLFYYLFFGTITAMGIAAVVCSLIFR